MSPVKKAAKKKPIKKPVTTTKAGGNHNATAVMEAVPRPAPARDETPAPAIQQEGPYVYGVIESRNPVAFGKNSNGTGNEDAYTVPHGNIAAGVSRTPRF